MGEGVVNNYSQVPVGACLVRLHSAGGDPPVVEVVTPTIGMRALTGAEAQAMRTATATSTSWTTWMATALGSHPSAEVADLREAVAGLMAWPTAGPAFELRQHFGQGGYDDVAPVAAADWQSVASAAAVGGSAWAAQLDASAPGLTHRTTDADETLATVVVLAVAF